MAKTKIPWADYTINPVKGLCPMDCKDNDGKSYCYARRMYKRFGWNPEIRYEPGAFAGLPGKPSRVFVGSTMELFGPWVERDWMHMTLAKCLARSWHTFIFLTKCPQNLAKEHFPPNCWVGVSATSDVKLTDAWAYLKGLKATVKVISIEPLLKWNMDAIDTKWTLRSAGINWLILGSRTGPVKHPPRAWVDEIIQAADNAHIPVFVKEPLASHIGIFRQEWPELGV